ncbi:MAG TPA: cache domain-containing protein [Rhizomicrobium sp.]|nr:cache domain-containing protein [Rhizomicrobium sp.]
MAVNRREGLTGRRRLFAKLWRGVKVRYKKRAFMLRRAMMKPALVISSLILMAAPALAATAEQRGTPAQAKAMLDKAVSYYKAHGREQALAAFTGKKSPFAARDLYVFCIGSDHKLVANGGFHEFIGQSADILKDSAGKSVGEAGWEIAMKQREGQLHYQWLNPTTHLIEPKVSYFARAGSDVCGVGAYDPGK